MNQLRSFAGSPSTISKYLAVLSRDILAIAGYLGIVRLAFGDVGQGEGMKRWVALAGVVAMCAAQPVWAADKPPDKVVSSKAGAQNNCPPAIAREAEQAIRFMTDLMVVSSVCQDTVYAEFRLRNRDVIVGYQKALIQHLRGNANFDKWNTALANQVAQKQGGNQMICTQSAGLMQQAKALDPTAFRAHAASLAATANPNCGK